MDDGSEEQTCRICRTNDPDLTLCRPCNCTGSIGLIHLECLTDWIQTINMQNGHWQVCEICHSEYKLEYRPKPFKQWEKLRLKPYEPCLIALFIVLFIVACVIAFYCMPVMMYNYIVENDVTAVNIWSQIMYGCIALFFICVAIRIIVYFVRLFTRWRAQNIALFPKAGVNIIRQNPIHTDLEMEKPSSDRNSSQSSSNMDTST